MDFVIFNDYYSISMYRNQIFLDFMNNYIYEIYRETPEEIPVLLLLVPVPVHKI